MGTFTVKQWDTDFTSHHIEGYARADAQQRHFSVPLVSHIAGDLWTGGCKRVRLGDDFRFVFSLYPWEQYILGPDTERIEIEMYDHGSMPDLEVLDSVAEQVVDRLHEGHKTLVHCQAGLNRSGLVAALALTKMGYTAREAIDLLREKRSPVVLCNSTFEQWLLSLDKED